MAMAGARVYVGWESSQAARGKIPRGTREKTCPGFFLYSFNYGRDAGRHGLAGPCRATC